MRKHQQRQILELLKTISEAQMAGLYADCQDGAIGIGDFIEQIEGEGTQTAALLEEYCKLLYDANNGAIGEKQLKKHLIRVENSVKSELKPNRIEVVFFPYQQSMWDSFESIYLAAKEDPNCDAYVVPIPYYEKNPDGTQGKMHYDGDQYPDSIGAVEWQSYDVELRHPDIVFTHYAYDDMTNNASIHQNFFSRRLRQHCEKLVHVPYFVTIGGTIDEYYGYLPGILHAHHVIAQSEAARQAFIKHYSKYDREFEWKGQFGAAEEKFIALGSPKFDKVINSKREDYELPEEWEKLIRKPDGTRKRVVLYNTHMFKWLDGGEQYFTKIHSVFDIFRSRDDVLLWWRPHPNTEMNFRIKYPHMLGKYAATIAEYIEGGWGIYDNTPDLHRALVYTDAYYGDWSSLIPMYTVTGKPVLTQNINFTDDVTKTDNRIINFYDVMVDEKVIWSVSWNLNGLFSFDTETNNLRFHGEIPNERAFEANLCVSLTKNKNSIMMAPYNSNCITKYDMDNSVFETIPLEGYVEHKFSDVLSFSGNTYFVPYSYPALLKYNIKTSDISKISDICAEFPEIKASNYECYFRKGAFIRDNSIMMITSAANVIANYNSESNEYRIYRVGNSDNKFISMVHDGKNYWLLTLDGQLLKWNEQTESVEEINFYQNALMHNETQSFAFLVVFEKSIFVFPSKSTMILEINADSNNVMTFADLNERVMYPSFLYNSAKYTWAEVIGEFIYAASNYENCLQKINPKTGEIENIPLKLSDDDYGKILSKSLFGNPPEGIAEPWQHSEIPPISLPFFLDRLVREPMGEKPAHSKKISSLANNMDGSCGLKTYEYFKLLVMQ